MDNQRWIAPEFYNLTSEMEQHPGDKIALKWLQENGDFEEITYGRLMAQANRLAGGLSGLGLKQGDRVLVMVPRRIIAYVIYLACLKLGLAVIPSSEMLRAKDLSYRLRHSEARAVIVWSEVTGEVNKIAEDLPSLDYRLSVGEAELGNGWVDLEGLMDGQSDSFPAVASRRDDIAILAYTSGTTGNPKAVVHTHGWGYAHLRITSSSGWISVNRILSGQRPHRAGRSGSGVHSSLYSATGLPASSIMALSIRTVIFSCCRMRRSGYCAAHLQSTV